MKRSRTIQKLLRAAVWLPVLCFTGCVRERLEIPAVRGGWMTLEATVAGFDLPVTRSIADGGGEAAVETVDVVVFYRDAGSQDQLRHYVAENIRQSGEGPEYKVSFDVELEPTAGAHTLMVVANASMEVMEAIYSASGRSKAIVLDRLRFNTMSATGRYEWDVSEEGYRPIPMYGELDVGSVAIGPGTRLTGIELTRMLARIDVENRVSGDVFRLREIYLVNYHTGGFIAPHWDRATGVIAKPGEPGYIYADNTDPLIPNDALKPDNTQMLAMRYEYAQDADAPGQPLAGQIYCYEDVKGDPDGVPPADQTQRICLILRGDYKGADCYYRVNFTSDRAIGGAGVAVGDAIPIYRNHKYIVTITDAEGVGYGTFDEALRSESVLSNLKTSVIVVDMAGMNHIVFDGQYFMGVESREVSVAWGAETHIWHNVSSDYLGSWEARILDPDAVDWLRFPGGGTVSRGTNINSVEIGIELESLPAPGRAEGRVAFAVGRLRDTLTVRRVAIADMMARSNVVISLGQQTFAVTEDDNASIPAWSQGVFFKWGSLMAVGPAGNPYDPMVHIAHDPDGPDPSGWGGGLAGWDRIPYAHSNFGFVTPPLSGDDMDALEGYGNGAGFVVSAGVGDVCRRISARAGWDKGNWRLPTYAEMEMLDNETHTPVKRGDFKDITDQLNAAVTGQNLNGMFNPRSGWLVGLDAGGTVVTDAQMQTPPPGTVFLPVSGHRYPDGGGDVVHVGAYGYYWTATPYDGITVNLPMLSAYFTMLFLDADRSYALPVRCIRDY